MADDALSDDAFGRFGPIIDTAYYTLYRLGYWALLEARCVTRGPDQSDLITHEVYFVLLDTRSLGRIDIGFALVTQGNEYLWDEDGEGVPRHRYGDQSPCSALHGSTADARQALTAAHAP